MLNQHQIDLVKSTVPVLENAGTDITDYFYQRMFSHEPGLKNIFNLSNQHSGRQQFALFSAVAAYAKHIDDPERLTAMVERIANKHASLNIQESHYPIVGKHLIATLKELAPEEFTSDVEEAWKKAYLMLANVFIQKESDIYNQNAASKGGWRGGRKFRLVEKRIESELVKSFVFEPSDGEGVVPYLPGQYIGLEVNPLGGDYTEIRQYSLSDKYSEDSYRISVKKELAEPQGQVSNFLHDQLRLGDEVVVYAPVGDFYIHSAESPVVLISAGVGLTPMQAILETLIEENANRDIFYLHACENSQQHSFKKRINHLADNGRLKKYTWYRNEQNALSDTFEGYMDLNMVEGQLPLAQADFYLCGPVPFMKNLKAQLTKLGVDEERIHYEVFGPGEDF